MKRNLICLAALFAASALSAEYYVDAARPDDSGAATNWATAKQTIQAAVDLAVDGDTVWVTNGVYDIGGKVTPGYKCMNRVVITNDIAVRSVNGSDSTCIVGAEALIPTEHGNGSNAVRCVYMSAGTLFGFTLTNGHTRVSEDWHYDLFGGGVNLYGGSGVVSNCTLSGNSAYMGGGSYHGTLNNCTFTNNSAENDGGGSYGSTLNSCVLTKNRSIYGVGGGSYGGTLNYCTVSGCSAWMGGGCYEGTLNHCTLSANDAEHGGGSAGGTLNNCVLFENDALYNGGGSLGGTLNNCTLTGNLTSNGNGGGSYGGTLRNCIVYSNISWAYASSDNWFGSSSDISSCCTIPDSGGIGNITNAPLFVNAASGDFRLMSNSLCINWGDNSVVSNAVDRSGNPRIVEGTVDMGAYEYQEIFGLTDSDGDQLPDDWERQFGGNQDPDRMGANNINTIRQAYIAGLDPSDPDSRFLASLDSEQVLRWNATSGRVYSVWCTTNLLSGFQCLETNIPWTSGQFDGTTNTSSQIFYKIDVQLEE